MSNDDYQVMEELATGDYYGVFIDDTGSPGLEDTPKTLHSERKTWVAVVVRPEQMRDVVANFPPVLMQIYATFNATEFHFADIFGGKEAFKGIDLDTRLRLFGFMAQIFNNYKFPILTETLDPPTVMTIRSRYRSIPSNFGFLDFTSPTDLALFLLFLRVSKFVKEDASSRNRQAYVFVDEGRLLHGKAIVTPWEPVFARQRIYFANSEAVYPLQLADFAAFSINRTQILVGRARMRPADAKLLEILSSVAFNYQNLVKLHGELSPDDKGFFDVINLRPAKDEPQ